MENIETLLTTTDTRALKLEEFLTYKQTKEETHYTYAINLERKYKRTDLGNKIKFVDVYTAGLINSELRQRLLSREVSITTISGLKEVVATILAHMSKIIK